jgi:NAD(P)-dependent dehydrogenase (short-subunit alcohol dehydrogenase family)
MPLEFADRHVVVTGAGGDLGGAVTRRLLELGATCHLPTRGNLDPGRFGSGHAGRVRVRSGVDLGDERAVDAFYAVLPTPWASIHCAGGFAMGALVETPLAELERMLAMNLTSVFLCCRGAARRMAGQGGGRIVNVAARPALEPRSGSGMAAYTASKAAVAALTVALAEELAADGIWVNAVAPAILDTPANRRSMPTADPSRWPTVDQVAVTIACLASPADAISRGAIVPV